MTQKERIIQYVLHTPCNNNRQILESLLSDIDLQPDWSQNDETKKDYIKNRPGGYYDDITTTTLDITATKQDESDKLTDVQVIEDNFRYGYEDSINVAIECSSGIIQRTLIKHSIPQYVINEWGAEIYGNAHLIAASEPDTGEDIAIYKEKIGLAESSYDLGWHIWALSLPSGNISLSAIKTEWCPIPFPSKFIPWKASPTADSVLYTAQSLTEEGQAQARANIGAGTPYILPQATAESLGGVKADSAEAADTQPVRIGGDGKLYTAPSVTDISLGLTSAAVGQTIKVKAVDESGKPTAWEAVDMPSGGGETWELINAIEIADGAEETNALTISVDKNGNAFSLKKARLITYFPKYTGESSIPGFSFTMINGFIAGSQAPICYTSGLPSPNKSNNSEGWLEVDLSMPGYEVERVARFAGSGNPPAQVMHWGARRLNGAETITSIGGTNMLIYPGCKFTLYGVRA